MRSRVLAVRTTGALVLSSALALTSSACTAGDNGPLDPNASAALPVVSAPSHLTAASASATAPASAAPSKPATTTKPIRTFASRSCHGTVFAQVPGDEQYGFTACGSAPYSRIYAIVGDGLRWRLTPLSARGIPLAAAGGTYLLYSAGKGNVSVLHRPAHGKINTFAVQQGPPNTFVGAITSGAGWWANWSETSFKRVWQAHTLRGKELAKVSSSRYAQHVSLTSIAAKPMQAWVETGGLYVGTPKGAGWTRSKVTSGAIGAPVIFRVGGHVAVAYPDYTHNLARIAVLTGKRWSIRSLGRLGSTDTSLVSAGATGAKAVVAWQTSTGLGLARLVDGHWKVTTYATAKDRALATTGRAVVREDGSLLLLGSHTSRVIG